MYGDSSGVSRLIDGNVTFNDPKHRHLGLLWMWVWVLAKKQLEKITQAHKKTIQNIGLPSWLIGVLLIVWIWKLWQKYQRFGILSETKSERFGIRWPCQFVVNSVYAITSSQNIIPRLGNGPLTSPKAHHISYATSLQAKLMWWLRATMRVVYDSIKHQNYTIIIVYFL